MQHQIEQGKAMLQRDKCSENRESCFLDATRHKTQNTAAQRDKKISEEDNKASIAETAQHTIDANAKAQHKWIKSKLGVV